MITKKSAIAALINQFPREHLFLSFSEAPSSEIIPVAWHNFGIKDNLASSAWSPPAWEAYGAHLPWTHNLIKRCLIGTSILYTETANLIYIFHDNEDYYFYLGRPPLACLGSDATNQLQKLPRDLVGFYHDLHNGFTFHPSNSMGPLPLADQPKLFDLYDGSCPPFSENSIGVFHNGAGDYLSVTPCSSSQHAFIWWHEEPEEPEVDLNLWAVMDNWISIFLEDTQVMRN